MVVGCALKNNGVLCNSNTLSVKRRPIHFRVKMLYFLYKLKQGTNTVKYSRYLVTRNMNRRKHLNFGLLLVWYSGHGHDSTYAGSVMN